MDNVVHFEIPAKNMGRAQKFYESVFGWKINPYMDNYVIAYTGPVDKKYMATKPGYINGAIQKSDKKTTCIVVNVKDVKKAIEAVKKAGGKLVRPVNKVEDMLLFAGVTDSEGNEIGLAQYLRKR